MIKRILLVLVVVVILGLCCSFSSATVTSGVPFFNLSQKSFGHGQVLEGALNFSLTNEPGNTLVIGRVVTNVKNMTLIDFLRESGGNFVCEPSSCDTTFIASNPSHSKMAVLGTQEKYFGLMTRKMNPTILNLSFRLTGQSAALPECGKSPLKLDLLDDNTIDWEYKEPSFDEWCTELRSSECFDPSMATTSSVLTATPVCQKISLNKTGRLQVAANLSVKEGSPTPGANDIEFLVFDSEGLLLGNCSVEYFEHYEPDYKLADCIIGPLYEGEQSAFYIKEEGDYFVCVKTSYTPYTAQAEYLIREEAYPEICGFYGTPPQQNFYADYAIFAKEAKFDAFTSEVVFNESMFLGQVPFLTYVQNYINTGYGGNCSGVQGCIIPLKFVSLADQTLILDNLEFKIQPQQGPPTYEYDFYDLVVDWPKINMSMQQLPFSTLNLTAPEQPTTYLVLATIGPAHGSANFKVEPVPTIQSVSPLIVVPGQTVMFRTVATTSPGRKIVQYMWDFGDGTGVQTTTEPNITHSYTQIKKYTLTVKAQDNMTLVGSRSFTITSNITKKLLNTTIRNLKIRLNNFISQYSTIDYWYRDMIGFDATTINTTLYALEQQLQTATQIQLIDIKNALDDLDVPISINDTLVLGDSPYVTNVDNIRPTYVVDITSESYDSNLKTQYQNAISLWQEDNFNLKISGKVLSLVYDDRIEDKLTVVNLNIDPLVGIPKAYVIFLLPVSYNNIRTLSNADETHDLTDAVGFSYTDLSAVETISIAIPGKHDFSELVFYVSPRLQDLGVAPPRPPAPSPKPPYTIAIFLGIVIILTVVIVLWMIWKGKKKEKKLFKNPMDLYNLTNFISNHQAAGIPKKKIIEQLKKAGWSRKQAEYAFKKIKEQKPIIYKPFSLPRPRRY